jgi:hypothetical protein
VSSRPINGALDLTTVFVVVNSVCSQTHRVAQVGFTGSPESVSSASRRVGPEFERALSMLYDSYSSQGKFAFAPDLRLFRTVRLSRSMIVKDSFKS